MGNFLFCPAGEHHVYRIESPMVAALGFLVAAVALVGTEMYGWEWGDGRLVSTLVGVVATGIAVLFVYRRYTTA